MARKPDWLHVADALDTERQAMQDSLPDGFVCCLTLSSYEFGGGRFNVSLWHRDKSRGLSGYGDGSTPAKALAAAKEDLQKNASERAKRPVLAAASPLVLTTKGGT